MRKIMTTMIECCAECAYCTSQRIYDNDDRRFLESRLEYYCAKNNYRHDALPGDFPEWCPLPDARVGAS